MHDTDSVQQKGHRSMLPTQTSASKITTKEQNYATWRYYFLANFITMKVNKTSFCTPLPFFLHRIRNNNFTESTAVWLTSIPVCVCVCVCVCACTCLCACVCVVVWGGVGDWGGLCRYLCVPVCVRSDEKNTKEIL